MNRITNLETEVIKQFAEKIKPKIALFTINPYSDTNSGVTTIKIKKGIVLTEQEKKLLHNFLRTKLSNETEIIQPRSDMIKGHEIITIVVRKIPQKKLLKLKKEFDEAS